jgi:hypothetical protein
MTRTRPGRSRWLACAAVGVSVAGLVACGGVPSHSVPQVVKRVGEAAQTNQVTATPQPGADPREIVSEFFDAMAAGDDTNHTAARSFLTADSQARWSDTTATVLQNYTISNVDNTGHIQVTGSQVGTLSPANSPAGAYSPVLQGDGFSGGPFTATFGLTREKGQWRINALQNGLILSQASFQGLYAQYQLFFFDQDEKYLVPDPRFSALHDPSLLANWLVTQLVSGPAPTLQNAVTSGFPAQTDSRRVTVTLGNPTTIALPGASALDGPTRNLLAGQLANTLAQVSTIHELQIVDTGRAVSIPQTGGTSFSALDFAGELADPVQEPTLYYIRQGGVVDVNGHPLPGAVGSGEYALSSAALAQVGAADLRVAGVSGTGTGERLLVGTLHGGLKTTDVRGELSRPAWVPGRDEVWVGAGSGLRRCTVGAGCATAAVVAANGSALRGTIAAVRFSPEGARAALVITAPDGTAQVWIGAVVRTATQVRVVDLTAITPAGVAVRDVAWNDPLKLFVIGQVIGTGTTDVDEVQADGSLWTPRTTANLPEAPDSITVAENQVAWVSAGQTVWVQRSGAWASPGNGATPGVNPVYLE